MAGRQPVVGQWYNAVCPTCCSTVTFECQSLSTYGVKCSTCGAMIDLRDPSKALPENDVGRPAAGSAAADRAVLYAADVEESDGLSAGAQVDIVITHMEEEKRKTMPSTMSGETTQAFSAQRNQAMAERFSFFYPVTHAIERLVFGTKPDAKIGNVRIFRKRIPFVGFVNVPVPKTTTSYAAPSCVTAFLFVGFAWFCFVADQDWLFNWLRLECVLVLVFYVMMFMLAYDDPGYVRPGYVDNNNGGGRASDEVTLKEIERDQRESQWETINGVPMERKWCSTCEMYRPVRAAHCYLCGLCCLDHDHHCSVIGVCVGRRRVERFTLFVNDTAGALIVPVLGMILGWHYHSSAFSTAQSYFALLVFIIMFFFCVVISLTAGSMLSSLAFEATTRERLQNVYLNKRNPFNRGVLRNLRYHFFERKVAPSLFDDEFVKTCAMRYELRELGKGKTVTCV